jgi:hypothetical protein
MTVRLFVSSALVVMAAGASAQSAGEGSALSIVEAAYKPADAKASFVDNYVRSFMISFRNNPQVAAGLARYPGLAETLQETVRSEAAKQYDLVVGPAMTSDLARLYKASFTPDELSDMAEYYRSPEAQRLLAALSAKAPAGELAVIQASPVIQRYLASAAGQKERNLSAQIASAMVQGMIAHADKVNAAVEPKVRAVIQAAVNAPRRP